MLPYYFLFAFFAIGALLSQPRPHAVGQGTGLEAGAPGQEQPLSPMLLLGGLLMALMIGFRYEVGGDWGAYMRYWQFAGMVDFARIMGRDDPGYQLLNWLGQQAGFSIWSVNLACGLIFTWGLLKFARTQPFPWLTVVVAVPYLVTVVAMGYARQAVAIGILMAGLASFFRTSSLLRFAFYALLATSFHKTAVLVLPLVIFSTGRGKIASLIGGTALVYGLYSAFLAEDVDRFVQNYVGAEYSSQGAAIRVTLLLIPALIYFSQRKRLGLDAGQDRFWKLSSYATLALTVALFVVPSSTAVDRMALYLFPLQLAILGRLPLLAGGLSGRLGVVLFALSVQVVWLNFASHARLWLPYQLYPL